MQIRKLASINVFIAITLVAISLYVIKLQNSKQSDPPIQSITSESTVIPSQSKSGNILKKSKENHSKNKITIDTEHDTLTELNGITPNDKAINLKGGILYKNNFSIDNWVIVDCNNRLILKCPHKLIKDKTTPSFFDNPRVIYLQGKCRDVTVDTRSFCGF